MNGKNKCIGIVAAVVVFMMCGGIFLWKGGIFSKAKPTARKSVSQEEEAVSNDVKEVSFSDKDCNTEWSSEEATMIACDGKEVTIEGANASEQDGKITIAAEGTYVFSGELENGQIYVDTDKDKDVHVVFNGFSIKGTGEVPFYGFSSDKIVLTLEKGTENSCEAVDITDEETKAVIYSKDDLTVNGEGKLTVVSKELSGIQSKNDLKVVSGVLQIEAGNDAMKGKDSVSIKDGAFTLEAACDGIQSDAALTVLGGTFAIKTGGGSPETVETMGNGFGGHPDFSGKDKFSGEKDMPEGETPSGRKEMQGNEGNRPDRRDFHGDGGNRPDRKEFQDGENPPEGKEAWSQNQNDSNGESKDTDSEDSESNKGIKGETAVIIRGGEFQIDSSDDGIHSNGFVSIEAGKFAIQTGDDAVHADGELSVLGGNMKIEKCNEGLEGGSVTMQEGTVSIVSADDGVNGAKITIQGGELLVDAEGDGIDSNGDLFVEGGTVYVNGPVSGGNGALDYNGEAKISGGTVIAVGNARMAESFSGESGQACIVAQWQDMQEGEEIVVEDEKGKEVVRFQPAKQWNHVVISSPKIKKGKSYTVIVGEEKQECAA